MWGCVVGNANSSDTAHVQMFQNVCLLLPLCQKDCHFRSKFDRHVRSTSHRLQENVQRITSESRKRSAPTLELPGGCASCEARTDSPSASDVQPVQVDVVNSSEEEVSDHSHGDIARSSDT